MPKRVYPDDLSLLPRSRPNIEACAYTAFVVVVSLVLALILFPPLFFILNRASGKQLYAEIPTIKIDSITVSNFNLSNPISAHWNINMTMHSTDSSFEFLDSAVSIFHKSKDEALWMTRLNGFDMRPENTTFLFALDFGGLADVNDTTVRAIADRITNNYGAVEFNVQFKADHSRSNISRLKKVLFNYATIVNILINWEVLLLFESPAKTRAHMLMTTENQACTVEYGFP